MKTKTEGDIPELFQQFNGNSANYQELTRAAAARASQARWPLLSAVELEQGDIPAVVDSATGLAVVEPVVLEQVLAAPTSQRETALPVQRPGNRDMQEQAAREAGAVPVAFVAAPGEVVSETEVVSDTDADSLPDMPSAVTLPGNTIFMAPAPYSARHFAQLERTLVARREAALAEIVVTHPTNSDEASLESLLAETQDAVIAAEPAALVGADDMPAGAPVVVAPTLAAEARRLSMAKPARVAPAPAETLTRPEATLAQPDAAPVRPEALPARSEAMHPLPETTPAPHAATHPRSDATLARPAAPRAPAPTQAADTATAAGKHAGLKPLFDRLAEPEDAATPVKSLFSRLMQS
jgi:hypothetical protein